jgi:hypothetical protein
MASCDGLYFAITNADASPTPAIKEEDASVLRVLSIDVGMKNLAYCLFECDPLKLDAGEIKTPESIMQRASIVAWDTINLCDTSIADVPIVPVICTQSGCKFAAKFMHSATDATTIVYYCTRHANASGYKMPLAPPVGSAKSLKKMTLDELKAFSGEYLSSSIPEKCEKSKMKLLQHLTSALANEYLVAVGARKKVVSAASVDLITIGRNMHQRFDALPHLSSGIDVVIIENQLSTLATRMKTLQGMITQYFIMRGVPDIRFISAINKLKLFAKEQGQDGEDCYADRKKRSIEITRALIANVPLMSMKFEKHKKKDDLADCFLQGVWWLSGNYVPRTPPSGIL